MAYTQKEMERQMVEFSAIVEEFSRLQSMEAQLRKAAGMVEGEASVDMNNLPPDMKQAMAEAQDAAKRAGAARVAQTTVSENPHTGAAPGAGRRGVVRL